VKQVLKTIGFVQLFSSVFWEGNGIKINKFKLKKKKRKKSKILAVKKVNRVSTVMLHELERF